MQLLTDFVYFHKAENFRTEGAADESEQCPNVLIFICGMGRVLE